MFILNEMSELIDDEETLVKIEAYKQLPKVITLFTKIEI